MDYPAKITRALETLNTARADGDIEAIHRAESGVIFAIISLDWDADFDCDADAHTVLDEEASSWMSADDSCVIMTIDDEDCATILRDDRRSWCFDSPGWRLFAAYQVACIVMHIMDEETITADNAWIIPLPLAILEGSDDE